MSEQPDQTAEVRGLRDRLEQWSAVLLAAATVATAYSAYESSRWSGEQSTKFSQAGATRTESAKAQSNGTSLVTIDATLFTEWAAAFTEENEELASALEQRFFREEFRPAFEEWVASEPLKNEDAAANPFELETYAPAELARADELEQEASSLFELGREANQTSDNYVVATIFFAMVLFFAGIATKFRRERIVAAMLGFGTLIFVGGVIRLFTLPFL